MSTWEERMAAKAAARRAERDGIARAADELRRADDLRREAEWIASLPPCPCPVDPCPVYVAYLEGHRTWWRDVERLGHCPDCGETLTLAEAWEHRCPYAIVLAG
jgi:hypothetical protein